MSATPVRFEADILSRIEKRTTESKRLTDAVLAWSDEAALGQSRALDALAAEGKDLPPLAGLAMSVKANVDVAGWTTGAGSRVLAAEPAATEDAPLVAELRRKGAIILAQTNMVEFAYGALGQNGHFGTPRTPVYANEARLPGGSSSGAGVSVGVGLVDAAIGTDTSGSVRIPASFCGVAAFKPTQGRYSDKGIVPLALSLDTAGFLATSIALCDRLDAAVTGRESQAAPSGSVSGQRFIVPRGFIERNSEPAVLEAFVAAISVLAAAGAEIEDRDMDYLSEIGDVARQGGIVSAESYVWHEPYIAARASLYDPRVGPRIAAGVNIRAVDYVKARARLAALSARYHAEISGFTAVLMPTTPSEPPLMSDIADDQRYLEINMRVMKFTEFANRINVPSLTMPIGGPNAAIGLMANGHHGGDVALLLAGRRIETSLAQNTKTGNAGR